MNLRRSQPPAEAHLEEARERSEARHANGASRRSGERESARLRSSSFGEVAP